MHSFRAPWMLVRRLATRRQEWAISNLQARYEWKIGMVERTSLASGDFSGGSTYILSERED